MKSYLCIDDTDSIGTPGSGHLLERLGLEIAEAGYGRPSRISRHQLFVHPDVPYTSHNSSMCMLLENVTDADALVRTCEDLIPRLAAAGSDPGICFVAEKDIRNPALLTEYGRRAKREVLTKESAKETASVCGLYLQELGGTGDGIIGAVAGIGLRFSGNDGRFRGKFSLPFAGGRASAGELAELPEIDGIIDAADNAMLGKDEIIAWEGLVKTVLFTGKSLLPVRRGKPGEEGWCVLNKDEIKACYP